MLTSSAKNTVNYALCPTSAASAFSAVSERVARRPSLQAHRHRAEAQFPADAVDQIAQIGVRELVDAGAEQDEARRPRVDLGDVSELDPFAARRRRRVLLDRVLEPAVELTGRDPLRPGFADLEGGG